MALADTTGSIRGTVADSSGALISKAHVVVTNEETNETRSANTDVNGAFQFLLLPTGTYSLRVEQPGFRSYLLRSIHLTVNQVATFNVGLQVGQALSKVEVVANAAQVDTATTQVGTVIDTKPIMDLPLNGRDLYQLIGLLPGITVPGNADANNPVYGVTTGPNPAMVFSSGGGRLVMNNFMVDGTDSNGTFSNQPVINLIPDATEEFRVITNTFNAEFGRNAGSVVNIITKSGTNQWHGDVFEFLRNDVLNARNYFEPPGVKASYKLNQFGGTLGGPISKDRTFIFGSFQDSRERKGADTTLDRVFSDAERGGDFSVRDPGGFFYYPPPPAPPVPYALTDALCLPIDSLTCTNYPAGTTYNSIFQSMGPGFQASMIPTPLFDPVSQNILTNLIPHANVGTQYFSSTPVQPNDSYQFTLKLDHQLNPKHKLAGFYFLDDNTVTYFGLTPQDLPGFPGTSKTRSQQINLAETWVKSPTTLNELRVAYVRVAMGEESQPLHTGSPASFGFTGITPGPPANLQSLPVIDIVGGPNFQGNGQGSGGGVDFQNVYQAEDNFSKISGRHALKFGADLRWIQYKQQLAYVFDGDFYFAGGGPNTTGDPFADFLLGLPDTYSQGSAHTQYLRSKQVGIYGQDTWQIRPSLTLNYGLRWELNTPYVDENNQLNVYRFPAGAGQPPPQSQVFPTAPPGFLFPGDPGVPRGLTQTYYKSFAPRIGLAYSPDWLGPNKLVVRSAYGIFYNPVEQYVLLEFNGEPPFGGSTLFTAPGFATPFVGQDGTLYPDPFPFVPAQPGESVDFSNYYPILLYGNYRPNQRSQYMEQYNLSAEYQLGASMVLGAGYVGSQGHRLLATYDANPGNPALCLSAVLAALGCGPYYEDVTFVDPVSGQTLYYGTRRAGAISNNGIQGVNGLEAFSSMFTIDSIAGSSYNSAQIHLERRASDLQFLASYTFSKSLDNSSGFQNLLNPFCFKCDRNLSAFDARHRFVFSYTYELPLKRFVSGGGVRQKLVDGWEIGGIYSYQTGVPVHLTDTSSDNSLTGGYDFEPADRPEIVGPIQMQDPHKSGCAFGTGAGTGLTCSPVPNQFFVNPNVFATEPEGQFGNARHNMFGGPPINNWDFTVIKRIALTERYSFEFRSEFFNLLNHTQFYNPDGDIGAGSQFGVISQARDPRFVQFGAKLAF
jgi:hypothetical protein